MCAIIIPNFILGTEIHGFFKATAWLRLEMNPRHFVITACCSQVHGLVCFNVNEPCLYF